MATSSAKTVDEYLASLPEDRREAVSAVRSVIKKTLPRGYEEGMQYGMIGYYIPLSRYPTTYNKQPLGIAAIGNQKGYMSLYLMGVYGDPATERWFKEEWAKSGKKLDMGKSCVRFKSVDDLPLDLVGKVVARVGVDDYIAKYESVKGPPRAARAAKAPAAKAARPAPARSEKTASRPAAAHAKRT